MYEAQVEEFSNQAAETINILAQRPEAIWVGGLLAVHMSNPLDTEAIENPESPIS